MKANSMKTSDIVAMIEGDVNWCFEQAESRDGVLFPFVSQEEITTLFKAQMLLEKLTIRLKNHGK